MSECPQPCTEYVASKRQWKRTRLNMPNSLPRFTFHLSHFTSPRNEEDRTQETVCCPSTWEETTGVEITSTSCKCWVKTYPTSTETRTVWSGLYFVVLSIAEPSAQHLPVRLWQLTWSVSICLSDRWNLYSMLWHLYMVRILGTANKMNFQSYNQWLILGTPLHLHLY